MMVVMAEVEADLHSVMNLPEAWILVKSAYKKLESTARRAENPAIAVESMAARQVQGRCGPILPALLLFQHRGALFVAANERLLPENRRRVAMIGRIAGFRSVCLTAERIQRRIAAE